MNTLQSGFFASLVFASSNGNVRQCNILLLAVSPDIALGKAQAAGVERCSNGEKFLGVEELLCIDGEIQNGVELVWRECLWAENDLNKFRKQNTFFLSVLSHPEVSSTGWYVGEITLLERVKIHLEGQQFLIWRSTYLLNESESQLAIQLLNDMGNAEQNEGDHTSDGQEATWQFLGVSMLKPVEELPADGSLLWCEQLKSSAAQISVRMPSRDELGVFRWLNRHQA
jgi:hypothetical protein